MEDRAAHDEHVDAAGCELLYVLEAGAAVHLHRKFENRVADAPDALQPKNANLAFLDKARGMAKPTRPAPPTRPPFNIADAWGKEKTAHPRPVEATTDAPPAQRART